MQRIKIIILLKKTMLVSYVFALAACGGLDMQKANVGGLTGAVIGAVAGGYTGAEFGGGLGQRLFIIAGAFGGANIGYDAGTILYPSDQQAYDNNARVALSTAINGEVSDWVNPETGNSGIFTPTKTFIAINGRTCRNYRSTLALKTRGNPKGVIAHQRGIACQQKDGSWRSLSENIG